MTANAFCDGAGSPPPPPPPPPAPIEDLCPNIGGIQNPVPAGMVKDGSGNCVATVCNPNEIRQQTDIGSACVVNTVYYQCNSYGTSYNQLPNTGGWYNSAQNGCEGASDGSVVEDMPSTWCGNANCYGGPFPQY